MLLVVAWDGACFDVVAPLLRIGELPHLQTLLRQGAHRRLRSTVPPVTFPAWTSFMTAASPGHHGILDFSVRPDHAYSIRFVNGSYRRLPTVWRMMSDAGMRVGVYALPATYPAEQLNGLQVCGFDTPFGAGGGAKCCYPSGLIAELEGRYGGIAVDGPAQSRLGVGWHEGALAEMERAVELRTDIVCDFLSRDDFDCFCVHYGESDTVAHHFWQFCDPRSPRYQPSSLDSGVADIYRALDRSLGRLLQVVPARTRVMLISDHGSGGASDRVIFWNRWLADQGLLGFSGSGSLRSRVLSTARKAALRVLPEQYQAQVFARLPRAAGTLEAAARFGGIDWRRTRVFSEELNYHPALWINRHGREPCGTVMADEVDHLVEEVIDRLRTWRDPLDGGRVVEKVIRREELFEGPYAEAAPDLIVQLRAPDGYSYCALPSRAGSERNAIRRMTASEMIGRRGTTMSGAHLRHGMCVLSGPGIRHGGYEDGEIPDAGATLLALAGLEAGAGADGIVWKEMLEAPSETLLGPHSETSLSDPRPYQEAEETEVAERLRALGYID